MVVDIAARHKGLRKIALGFTFDFRLVRLLLDLVAGSSC